MSNSLEMLHIACLHGRGIACLPRYLVQEDIEAGRLHSLLDVFREDDQGLRYRF